MLSDPQLWTRIEGFALDRAGVAFPFSHRLRRENDWSPKRASGAIDEYKRFVYLLCVADGPLTPSEAVDQVWHLHLVYTRSYWVELCDGILGRRIDHDPTKGGDAQAARFKDQYAATYALYEREFGVLPPSDFWPRPADRFTRMQRLQWVDRQGNWVVPKPSLSRLIKSSALGSVASLALVLLSGTPDVAAQTEAGPEQELGHLSGWFKVVMEIFLGLFALVLIAAFIDRSHKTPEEKKKNRWWGCAGCGGCGGCGG